MGINVKAKQQILTIPNQNSRLDIHEKHNRGKGFLDLHLHFLTNPEIFLSLSIHAELHSSKRRRNASKSASRVKVPHDFRPTFFPAKIWLSFAQRVEIESAISLQISIRTPEKLTIQSEGKKKPADKFQETIIIESR